MRRMFAAAAMAATSGAALSAYGVAAPSHLRPPAPGRAVVVASPSTAPHRRLPPLEPPGTTSRQKPATSRPAGARSPARSAPVRVAIPALGISSALGPARGLRADGTIADAPLSGPTWSLPWWYDGGPAPGQSGSAVILGHVDSAAGAGHLGVFFRLGALRPGQQIAVTSAGGVVTYWSVISTRLYGNRNFPDALVYRRAGPPVLRLVTCGGSFDWKTRLYQSATVVTARPTVTGPGKSAAPDTSRARGGNRASTP